MDDLLLEPGQSHGVIQTGIAAAAPPECYLRVVPRSGLTVKKNLNTLAGVIDPDYRGNIGVVLHNFGTSAQTIKRSDKIAQLIVERADTPTVVECDNLNPTDRGTAGFGSTDAPSLKKPLPLKITLKELPIPQHNININIHTKVLFLPHMLLLLLLLLSKMPQRISICHFPYHLTLILQLRLLILSLIGQSAYLVHTIS